MVAIASSRLGWQVQLFHGGLLKVVGQCVQLPPRLAAVDHAAEEERGRRASAHGSSGLSERWWQVPLHDPRNIHCVGAKLGREVAVAEVGERALWRRRIHEGARRGALQPARRGHWGCASRRSWE